MTNNHKDKQSDREGIIPALVLGLGIPTALAVGWHFLDKIEAENAARVEAMQRTEEERVSRQVPVHIRDLTP